MSASDATLTAYSWQELLMEAARRQDEAQHVAQSAAAANGRVIAFPGPDSHELTFEALPGVTPAPTTAPRLASVPPAAEFVHAEGSGILSMRVDSRSNSAGSVGPVGPVGMTSEITTLLEEATTCYLRRDLARAGTLLQQCLALRPDHKQALQNLERIRRKKSP